MGLVILTRVDFEHTGRRLYIPTESIELTINSSEFSCRRDVGVWSDIDLYWPEIFSFP